MKIEMQNDVGMSIELGQAAVTRLTGDLRSPCGEVIRSSETTALLQVGAALVESVRRNGGALSMTCELQCSDFGFGVLLMRSEDEIALLLFDVARNDVKNWLNAAVEHDYMPVAMLAGERAIQVRLPVGNRVRELLELGRKCRPADQDEHFSAFSRVLALLENIDFLRDLSIDPATVGTVSFLVLSDNDGSDPTDAELSCAAQASSMH